jgi:8-oxo-dGTP diphosphatase
VAAAQSPGAGDRHVVIAVLRNQDEICLLRRSVDVAFDSGRWHGITGYLPVDAAPAKHALAEVHEETGFDARSVTAVRPSVPISIQDQSLRWVVHPFLVDVSTRAITLNWENDASCWVGDITQFTGPTVSWLHCALRALGLRYCEPCLDHRECQLGSGSGGRASGASLQIREDPRLEG